MTETTRSCPVPRRDGKPCKGRPVKLDPEGRCATHSPLINQNNLLTGGKATVLARQGVEARRAKAEERKRLAEQDGMTVRDALRAEAARSRDTLVAALFAPLGNPELDAVTKQKAAIAILERILGRPTEALDGADTYDAQPIDWAEVAQLWADEQDEEGPEGWAGGELREQHDGG